MPPLSPQGAHGFESDAVRRRAHDREVIVCALQPQFADSWVIDCGARIDLRHRSELVLGRSKSILEYQELRPPLYEVIGHLCQVALRAPKRTRIKLEGKPWRTGNAFSCRPFANPPLVLWFIYFGEESADLMPERTHTVGATSRDGQLSTRASYVRRYRAAPRQ
jgi:hypothetical protein